MCVTNTTQSRVQAVSLTAAQMQGVTPSLISQRLLGTFQCDASFPAMPAKPATFSFPVNNVNNEMFNTVPSEKPRTKRRRKPQKPGKTAKMNDRHFVVHNYHDHSNDVDDETDTQQVDENERRRGGVSISFPIKLHAVLLQVERDGLSHVVSWMPHGRCFVIHKPKEFVDHVMPQYFRQTKLTSFQRQLNLYGFQRVTRGADAGGYYHELFLRGREFLCKQMTRTKVKGTKFKAASSPEQEPDFYQLVPVLATTVTPLGSDEELSYDYPSSPDHSFACAPVASLPVAEPKAMFNFQSAVAQPTPPPLSRQVQMTYFNYLNASAMAPVQPPMQSDGILDQAVDELFMNEVDTLDEFAHDWDPGMNFGAALEDDAQLGFMLEKLLED